MLLWEAVVAGERWLFMCNGGKLEDGGNGRVTYEGVRGSISCWKRGWGLRRYEK